ncbi:HK97 family phage prohead protease [Bacillus cereus]|uniref:HK97 family phage prohead protease n=2 Tax=Bacillus TaxID=1386 RepID=UPI0020D278F5|nr:HK97 family phage prohead protease [Bacillus cereus]
MPTGLTFVSGYVNKTGTWSQVLGRNTKFIEQIRSVAFKRALERAENINFLYEHDKNKILADTRSGKLILREDSSHGSRSRKNPMKIQHSPYLLL